ncbi:helix-turn-helix transcriptional regulator [Sphingopyxis sp.]
MMSYQDHSAENRVNNSGAGAIFAGLPRMIRRHELKLIVPLADSTIFEMERRGEFPRRFNLTPRCVVWIWRRLRLGSLIVAKAVWKIARR